MQNRRSSSYSNVNTQFEIELAEERQCLLDNQKACRIRAHKLSAETNRRRRAIEEKRKEEEEKEQKFREEVLQQRRQKLQEATEKFQRAHLPPSQRRKRACVVHRKPTPRLEDALEQIQGSILSSFYYSTSRPSSTRITDPPSYSTAIGNGAWFQKQLSTRGSYDKEIQERNGANLDNNQLLFQQKLEETQRLLETQHLSNLQNFHQEVNQVTVSESVSSLDSLEDGVKSQTEVAFSETLSQEIQEDSTAQDSNKAQPTNNVPSHMTTLADLTFPKNQQVNNWLGNLDHQNTLTNTVSQKLQLKIKIPTIDEHANNQNQKSSVSSMTDQLKTDIRVANNVTPCVNTQYVSQNKEEAKSLTINNELKSPTPACEIVNKESVLASQIPAFKPSRAWTTPDPTPRDIAQICIKKDDSIDMTQNFGTTSDQLIATSVIFPLNQWHNSTGTQYSVNSNNSNNPLQRGKHQRKITVVPTSDNLSNLTEINADCQSIKIDQINDATNQGPILFDVISKHPNSNHMDRKEEKENVTEIPSTSFRTESSPSLSTHHLKLQIKNTERGGTKLLKSILKKDSKYENGYSGSFIISRGIKIGTRNALSIRDSVELAKGKEKVPETQKVNKKLRWFDEVEKIVIEEKSSKNNTNNILESQSPPIQTKGNTSYINLKNMNARVTNYANTENQGYTLLATKVIAPGGCETAGMYGNSFISTGYHFTKQAWTASKGEEANSSGCISDSALQKNCLGKGKTKLIRRPRSAKLQSTLAYKNRKGTVIRPQSASEANNAVKTQGKIILPHPPTKSVLDIRGVQNITDTIYQQLHPPKPESNPTNSHFDARDIMLADLNKDSLEKNPSLQNAAHSTNAVTIVLSPPSYNVPSYEAVKKTTLQDNSSAYTRRSPIYGENGLRLDRTPTDEEISLLWNGVRNALTQKDHAAGDFHYYDGHCNIPCSTNLPPSRANISHVTIDGTSLMNNFRSSSRMNGLLSTPPSGTLAITRRKPIVDSSENKHRALLEQRRHISSSVTRRLPQHVQSSVRTVQLSPFPSAFEPGQNMSGVTDPEEDVKEAIIKNPSVTSILQVSSPLRSIHQSTSTQPMDTTLGGHRNRSISADSRTRLQRRY
ncbi:centrosomal protein of 126 kDa isoform X2 [Rhinatrema bivittatum]|uniref:centrosomal protein of 126 kDa isoform X2 n=1 Tax=Rhinatrema bivittatum TaxID=194408 RepID=UPI00112EA8EB|nr:centrosomal protein of 126 kDa isoform X2 [Rhinatrema bivittatum]